MSSRFFFGRKNGNNTNTKRSKEKRKQTPFTPRKGRNKVNKQEKEKITQINSEVTLCIKKAKPPPKSPELIDILSESRVEYLLYDVDIDSDPVSYTTIKKDFYTYDDFITLKPKTKKDIKKDLSCVSGYLKLLSFTKERSSLKHSGNAKIETHVHNKFVSNTERLKSNQISLDSIDSKVGQARKIMNSLFLHNGLEVASAALDISKLNLKNSYVTGLLLDFLKLDHDIPEKSQALILFIMVAIYYTRHVSTFATDLVSSVFARMRSLLGSSSNVSEARTLMVFISGLFNSGMIGESLMYNLLREIERNGDIELTIDLFSAAVHMLYINAKVRGKVVDSRFDFCLKFLEENESKFTYKKFLVSILLQIRDNDWNPDIIKQPVHTKSESKTVTDPEVQEMSSTQSSSFFDSKFMYLSEYNEWLENESAALSNFDLDSIILITQCLILEIPNQVESIVHFSTTLCLNSKQEHKGIDDDIARLFPDMEERVDLEKNCHLWEGYFMFLMKLFDEQIVKFETIKSLMKRASESALPPVISRVIFNMSKISGFNIEQVIELKREFYDSDDSTKDLIQSLILITDFSLDDSIDYETFTQISIIHCGVFIRELMLNALTNISDSLLDVVEPYIPAMMNLPQKYDKELIDVTKAILLIPEYDTETTREIIELFLNKVLCPS